MNKSQVDEILNQLGNQKRCYYGLEDEELSTVVSIERKSGDLYSYNYSVSHKYDVVAPTEYDNRVVNQTELEHLLSTLPDEAFDRISYVDTNIPSEKNRDKSDLILAYLKQQPKVVYVVFKEDRWSKNRDMHFNGLYPTSEQAERMTDYLRTKQGAQAYWKEIMLTLQGNEIVFRGELLNTEKLTSNQILVTLLDMDAHQIERFFHR